MASSGFHHRERLDMGHDSSPLCHYCGGQYALSMYENLWCSTQGNGAPCDWSYTPSPASHEYPLSVSVAGTGSRGTGLPPPRRGISCGSACSASYSSRTQVTLTATAGSGSTFVGWGGVSSCPGTGTCTLPMYASNSVQATFNLNGPQIWAVVDGVTYSSTIYPSTTIAIFSWLIKPEGIWSTSSAPAIWTCGSSAATAIIFGI